MLGIEVGTNVLVVSPHTDDAELCVGATINKLRRLGVNVTTLAVAPITKDGQLFLLNEFHDACGVLGVEFMECAYRIRSLPARRDEVLDSLYAVKENLKPDVVFIPAPGDLHQDHSTVHHEAMRVFRDCTVFGYGLPHNNPSFRADCFSVVSKEDVLKKCEAIHCYKSQAYRPYMNSDFVHSWARVNGVHIGTKYAEAFTVCRFILG